MSLFSFLGGLSGAAQHISKGVNDAQHRLDADEARKNARQDREFQRGQRQRLLDEQTRQDRLREQNAKIKVTEDDPAPAPAPAPTAINDIAAQALAEDAPPVAKPVQPPAVPTASELPPVPAGASTVSPGAAAPAAATASEKLVETPPPAAAPAAAPVRQPRRRMYDAVLREQAENHRAAGDMDAWAKLNERADAISAQRSATMFQHARSAAGGKTTLQLAQSLQAIYNNDHLPQQVAGIKEIDGGGVRITFRSSETGQEVERDFANPAQLLEASEAYFSPASYASLQQLRQKKLLDLEEERAKNRSKLITTKPGETVYDAEAGRAVYENDQPYRGYDFDDDGNPKYIGPVGRGGAGGTGGSRAGASKSAKQVDPYAAYDQQLEDGAKAVEGKFANIGEYAGVKRLAKQIGVNSNLSVPPELALEVAYGATTNPAAVSIQLNRNTGEPDRVYRHPTQGTFALDRNVDTSSLKPEDRAAMGAQYLAAQAPDGVMKAPAKGGGFAPLDPAGYQKQLLSMARDTSGVSRANLETQVRGAADADFAQALKDNPGATDEQKQLARQRIDGLVDQALARADRSVATLRQWHPEARPSSRGGTQLPDGSTYTPRTPRGSVQSTAPGLSRPGGLLGGLEYLSLGGVR